MKKFFTVLLFGLLCLTTVCTFAQSPCPEKPLTTSTTASVNIENPTMKNFDPTRPHPMIFDWTREYFSVQSNAPDIRYRASIQSPFFQRTNNITNHLSDHPDMQSDDGWELIRQDFGYVYQLYLPVDPTGLKRTDGAGNPAPVGNPFFILYNRYTGILRVFVAVGQLSEHTGARIKIYQIKGSGGTLRSSLLYESSEAKPVSALDDFMRSEITVVSRFSNYEGSWLYADFPTMYDPCTCLYSSSLQIDVHLIQEAQIDLTGETEGTLVSIANNQGQVNNDDRSMAFGLTDLENAAKKAAETFKDTEDMTNKAWETINTSKQREAIAKGLGDSTEIKGLVTTEEWQNFYNSLTPVGQAVMDIIFQKYERKKEEMKWFDPLLSTFDFLEKPLKVVPLVAAAVDVFDFFVGGGRKEPAGPQKVEVQPMAIRMTTKLQGTITAPHYYGSVTFFTPGAKDNATRLPQADYPMYNQTLGVFNLLTTPKVKSHYHSEAVQFVPQGSGPLPVLVCQGKNAATRYYQLAEDVKYVVNPAAGFDMDNIEVLAALVFEFDYDIDKELQQYDRSQLVLESYNRYRTRFVPVGCLKDLFVPFRYNEYSCPPDAVVRLGDPPILVPAPVSRAPQVHLKLVVRLVRDDADENTQGVLFAAKYPVSLVDVPTYDPAAWTTYSAYDDVPDDIVYSNQNVSSRYEAWKTITVDAGTDVGEQPGMIRAGLTAGTRITVKPGSRIRKSSTLRIGMPDLCSRSVPPATAAEVTDFCTSTAYQIPRQFPKEIVEGVEPGPGRDVGSAVLLGISPNPSADRVSIQYRVGGPSPVTIEIVNPLGVTVGLVVSDGEHAAGEYTAGFDGSALARGVYYCVLRCNGDVQMRQFVVY